MGSAIWTFLNSPIGVTLVLGALGELFRRGVKSKSRRDKILEYSKLAFDLAEMIGRSQGLSGVQKYSLYLRELADKLKANGEKDLTPKEKAQLERLAYERAWLTKLPKPSMSAKLPLPAPPGKD